MKIKVICAFLGLALSNDDILDQLTDPNSP